MPVTELAFRPDVNVSIATGNGRFSAVDQWPVLGVHRGLTFSLLTLAPMASLLCARRVGTAFAASVAVGVAAVSGGLVSAFYLDLPPGPASVGWLVLLVLVAAGVSRITGPRPRRTAGRPRR